MNRQPSALRSSVLILILLLASGSAAMAAGQPALFNLRLEPDPVQAYGTLRFRADYAAPEAPVVRLWWRLLREGRQGEPLPVALPRDKGSGSSGVLMHQAELGEPGPRLLTVSIEDEAGRRSAPSELRFHPVEPAPAMEELEYKSEGLRIKAYLYRPHGVARPPVVVYSHGSRMRAELPEKLTYQWLGYRLVRLGYAVFVPERRGYGGSEGEGVVGNEGLASLRTGLPGEVKDLLAAVDFLRGRPDVDGGRIILVGKSLGGFVSLMAAADRPDLRGLVSLAGGYGFGSRNIGPEMLYTQGQLREAARGIRIPTLLMHCENDQIVPPDLSRLVAQELYQRGVPVVLKMYPPFKVREQTMDGHALFERVDGMPLFWNDFTGFLAANLKP